MKDLKTILAGIQSRITEYQKKIEANKNLAEKDYMRFFVTGATDTYILHYKIKQLSVLIPDDEEEFDASTLQELLEGRIEVFENALLERPLMAASTNPMHNKANELELEAMQDLRRLYKSLLKTLNGKS